MKNILLSSTLFVSALFSGLTGSAQALCDDFGEKGLAVGLESDATYFNSAIVLSNGKIVAVGYYDDEEDKDFLIARFNADGTPDMNFGRGGLQVFDLTANHKDDIAMSVAMAPDGHLLVGGVSNGYGTLIKIAGNGLLVASFGTNGQVRYGTLYSSVEEILIHNNTIYTVGKTIDTENIAVRILRINAYNTNGTPVTTYGEDGIYLNYQFHLWHLDQLDADLQSDGKIVVSSGFGGSNNNDYWRVLRINTDGTTDTSFGTNGLVEFTEPGTASVEDIKIGSDGSIYLGGYTQRDSELGAQAMVKKLNTNGAPINAFHDDGSAIHTGAGTKAWVNAIDIDASGKVYIAGSKQNNSGEAEFLLAAFNANGTIDVGFGIHVDRIPHTNGGELRDLIRLSNGDFIGCGYVNGFDHEYGVVVKYKSTGQLDPSFGVNGAATARFATTSTLSAVTRTAGGKIVTAGTYIRQGSNTGIVVSRFNPDGTADINFGQYGYVRHDFDPLPQYARAVHVYDDGKILVGGNMLNPTSGEDYLLVRLKPDGTLDNTFGTNGVFSKHHGVYGKNNTLFNIRVDAQGRILIVGDANYAGSSYNDATMMRLLPNGNMDTSFGTDGVTTVKIAAAHDTFTDVAIMADGSYLVLGHGILNPGGVVVKLSSAGVVDTNFGNNGIFVLPWDDVDEEVQPLHVLSNSGNKLLIGGNVKKKTQPVSSPLLYRINTSGTVDNTFNGTGYKVMTDFPDGMRVGWEVDGDNIIVGGERQTANGDFSLQILNIDGGEVSMHNFDVGEDSVVELVKSSGGYIAAFTIQNGLGVLVCLNPHGSSGNSGDCSGVSTPTISASDDMLIATEGNSFQWYKDGQTIPGGTSRELQVDLLDAAIYKVKVTTGGCSLFSADYFNLITAISPEKAQSISVYPNPVHGDIVIRSTTDLRDVTLELYSPQGALLNPNSTATGFSTTLPGEGLTPGVYFLRAKSNHGTEIIRILKTR